MAESRMREDVESAYLDITEFTGQSLTGPRELLTRKVLCSNAQAIIVPAGTAGLDTAAARIGSNQLQQLNFRILSTSPGAMLNAKVELVMPMIFHHAISHNAQAAADIALYYGVAGAAAGDRGWTHVNLAGQYAPRRNGILKACASISTTVNSTVSFTVRPGDEAVDVMEQIFTQRCWWTNGSLQPGGVRLVGEYRWRSTRGRAKRRPR